MKKLITLLLLSFLSISIATAQESEIKGILGFKLGMSKEEAKKVLQSKGWNRLSKNEGTIEESKGEISIDFKSAQSSSGVFLDHLGLAFYSNKLAKIYITSPTENYHKQKPISAYYNYDLVKRICEKYGYDSLGVCQGDGTEIYLNQTTGPIYLTPVEGDEFEFKDSLSFHWDIGDRWIRVNYSKSRESVFIAIHYADSWLLDAYRQKERLDDI